jgi:N-acetylmuramoyl-L-alanine amidase
MDNGPSDWPDSRPDLISRRRLLWLSGAGLAATVSGCALWDHPTPPNTQSPPAPANPAASPIASSTANLPATPMTTTAPAVTPASRVMLCRDAWGAKPPRADGTLHIPNKMTIHHTAAFLGDNSNSPTRLRQHQHYHQDTQGWIDIAYHVGVDRNGNIFELRNPERVGDTATRYDPTGHFLVVCEGNFDEEDVTEEQLNGAALAFAWAAERFEIPTEALTGHRDESNDTACPGASLYGRIEDLKSRIAGLRAAGPVDLMTICGPEASQIVADIEAGRR